MIENQSILQQLECFLVKGQCFRCGSKEIRYSNFSSKRFIFHCANCGQQNKYSFQDFIKFSNSISQLYKSGDKNREE